jgi:chromosome partitioning protein
MPKNKKGGKMIKLTIANQRGGIGKTTTALTLARCFADDGKRVLLIDTDPQGSIFITLDVGNKVKGWLHQFLIENLALNEVITPVYEKEQGRIDLIASDRRTMRIEGHLSTMPAREMVFTSLLASAEPRYDAIIFDVAPSISTLQTCAIAYTESVLCPVGMDALSIEGAMGSLQVIEILNKWFKLDCRCVGFLPTMVDKRLSATEFVLNALQHESEERHIPLLHEIRTDHAVNRSARNNRFLQDWDGKSKALEDYLAAYKQLIANEQKISANGAGK